jgi:2C-methyl-D-erythritol 2,4-cyclodiphosphate synthase
MTHVERAELAVDSVDVTILGVRPRLGGKRLDAIATSISELIGAAAGRVSVKAASGNLSGDDGAGRTMSATCLVGLVPR